MSSYTPFKSLTVDELLFGYDDTLVNLAHKFYPREKRPMSKMGLLIGVSNFPNIILPVLTNGSMISAMEH